MKNFIFILFISLILLSSATYSKTTTKKHNFSVHDLLAMDRISDIQLSPDEQYIAFVLRKTDLDTNKGRTDIWLLNITNKKLKQFTSNKESDYNPRWSPSGKNIYFISTRSGSPQIWVKSIDISEPKQITDLPLSVGNLIVSPDGNKIAFTMEVFPKLSYEETKNKLDERKNRKATGRIYTDLFIRHWDTWEDGRRSHIFIKDLNTNKIVDIMKNSDTDSPSQPFGGSEEFCFDPASSHIVFTASSAGEREAWSTNFDLFVAPINGHSQPELLTAKNQAWDTTPVFSPDGQYLAYLAMKRPGYESDRFRIVITEKGTMGKRKILTENWDRSPSSIAWSKDSKFIYATASDLGQVSLFKLNIKNKKREKIIDKGTVRSVNIGENKIFYGLDNLKSPVEIYSSDFDGLNTKKLTEINKKQLDSVRMGDYEQFSFKGWNNDEVYCYIVKPAEFNPEKKYPVAFLIHGGPQGSFGNDFHYRWNPQVYTGAGFAAVMVDFHGSVGYGQEFTDSIRGNWGGKPLVDLKKGLKAALERYPWMDKENVVALGASFGGYMINWIEGNWPDRFKCLVNHDGNLDERMAYYDTEELWFPEWEHNGTPWENPQGYEKHNPVNFIENWKTPMLVIHGAKDFRVVETQGFGTFNALQRKGISSKLLYFPDENHWVLKPHNSILWHNTVIDWIKSWIEE